MVIDHQAVSEAVEQIEAVAEGLDAAAVAVNADAADAVAAVPVGEFAFRPALNAAESWWYSRVVDHRDHLVDLAQFMATNAAVAAQHDQDSESDMVELGEELQVGVGEYTVSDYYEATGAERPDYHPAALPTDGKSVAVE